MRTKLFVIASLIALLTLTANALAQTTYVIDTDRSSVKWSGKKIVGSGHHGTIDLESGRIQVQDGKITRGQFVIDMTSIKNEDITRESNRTRLENHLKSDDFFNVSQHPTARFVLQEATAGKDGTWQVNGSLSVRGNTHPISFPAAITIAENNATAKGKVTFDRAQYEVRYNSGRFFDPRQLGDNLINDEIEIELDLFASKQEQQAKSPRKQKRRPKETK